MVSTVRFIPICHARSFDCYVTHSSWRLVSGTAVYAIFLWMIMNLDLIFFRHIIKLEFISRIGYTGFHKDPETLQISRYHSAGMSNSNSRSFYEPVYVT